MAPKISVIFPIGDRPAFLAEALESVLGQSFSDFELLVVLDGVSEPVQAIVESYRDERIRIIRLPLNLGVSTARNAAMLVARAPYMALMDSDDVALPQRLAQQHAWMQAHPEITVCGSNAVKLLEDGRRASMVYPQTDGIIKARLLLVDSAILNPTAMLRSDFVRQHDLRYDANFPRDQDHRFYVEMTRLGATFCVLPEELLLYRRHAGNVTRDLDGVDQEKTRVRELLLPLYFPDLSGEDYRVLLQGLCRRVDMTLEQACHFLVAVDKAMRETRSFRGEDRDELRSLLARFGQRVRQKIAPS